MLGCYVGPVGFSARGVPEGFLGGGKLEKGKSSVRGNMNPIEANPEKEISNLMDSNGDYPADPGILEHDDSMEVDINV
jgi:hypothetical protein